MRRFCAARLYALAAALFLAGCGEQKPSIPSAPIPPPRLPAPNPLPRTDRAMQSAGFWIARHPDPDGVVMSPAEIEALNARIGGVMGLVADLTARAEESGDGRRIKASLTATFKSIRKPSLYTSDGRPASETLWTELLENLNRGALLAHMPVRYGFLTGYAEQRALPTETALFEEPGDRDFDVLRNSTFDAGTALLIVHESLDGRWIYGRTTTSEGWFRKGVEATCPRDRFEALLRHEPFVVVTSPRVDVFADRERRRHRGTLRMGMRLATRAAPTGDLTEVILFGRAPDGSGIEESAFLDTRGVHAGYWPFTARVILEQAFALLNQPYGWAGRNGEHDCSSYLQDVFATVGLQLPRNSASQARVGHRIGAFADNTDDAAKLDVLTRGATAGLTTLELKGHIMLYLGMVDGTPYAIHDIWAYREGRGGGAALRVIGRVAVTDLSLGADGEKGSLLRRIRRAQVLGRAESP